MRMCAYPFESLEESFQALVAGPKPLSIDCSGFGPGLPSREIPLGQLRERLLHPSVSFVAREAAVAKLVRLAQSSQSAYVVGLAGVLLPGLRSSAANLIKASPNIAADLESEMLTGLVEAIAAERLTSPRLASRLVWAAWRRGQALLHTELAHEIRTPFRESRQVPIQLAGHPDLVLAHAVESDVITAFEAEIIGESRVGEVPLHDLAIAWGVAYNTLQKRRRRAEFALTEWIISGRVSAKCPKTTVIGVEVDPGRGANRKPRVAP